MLPQRFPLLRTRVPGAASGPLAFVVASIRSIPEPTTNLATDPVCILGHSLESIQRCPAPSFPAWRRSLRASRPGAGIAREDGGAASAATYGEVPHRRLHSN